MAGRELAAAGITDPALRRGYMRGRALHASHGRSYFLATRLLPPDRRPAVHALYGFARYADELVDSVDDQRSPDDRAAALDALAEGLDRAPRDPDGVDPLLVAVADTAARYRIDRTLFTAFLDAMRMDTKVTEYPSYAALAEYMHGSAATIGLQLLPVLGTVCPPEEAAPSAETLGVAFQLTNFLRDVGEDLDRGRVYLPADELAAFGVHRELLDWCRREGRTDPRVRRALAYLVARARAKYREAAPGIGLLHPAARPCIRTAFTLYAGILGEIEAADYPVLHHRVVVPVGQRFGAALTALPRSWAARLYRSGNA
ncbi:phytoene/squalene synthase family protein [Pseudonocardia eucalypti]|uniref:Phytoene/squalene synthase family protein n=1 Tax=Pseudonocardia eucalypti TaxID=648755 RepID=A0ABP9QVH7_9PSEU|nr:phytoene synthase [Pseudonocardia eucalypti]